jgi:DNA-binding CsgD family transcriptional regulator
MTCRHDRLPPAPVLVAAASRQGDAAARAGQRHLQGRHDRLDDKLRSLPALAGHLAFSQLQATQLPDSAWRHDCWDDLGLAGRLSLLVPSSEQWIVLNAYRPHRCAGPDAHAVRRLRQQAPTLAAALRRHLTLSAPVGTAGTADDPLAALSARERQVVDAILAGLSAKACVRQRGRSPTSVATYRQRAFQKLGLRRQVELFRLAGGGFGPSAHPAHHAHPAR